MATGEKEKQVIRNKNLFAFAFTTGAIVSFVCFYYGSVLCFALQEQKQVKTKIV
jgi:hypothetical protein